MANRTPHGHRTTPAAPTASEAACRRDDGHSGSDPLAQTRYSVGTPADVVLAERRWYRAFVDDSARRRLPLAGLSPLDRGPLESQTDPCIQVGASTADVSDASVDWRIGSVGHLPGLRLSLLCGTQCGSLRIRLLAPCRERPVPRVVPNGLCGASKVRHDRLLDRIRADRRGAQLLHGFRLGSLGVRALTSSERQPQTNSSAGSQGTDVGFEPPVSSLGAAAEATCRSDISLATA